MFPAGPEEVSKSGDCPGNNNVKRVWQMTQSNCDLPKVRISWSLECWCLSFYSILLPNFMHLQYQMYQHSVSHSSHFRFFEVLHSNKASSKYMGKWLSTFCRLALTHVNSCSAISLQRLYCTQMPSATLALYKYWQLVSSTTRSKLLSGSKIKGALRNGYQYTAVQQGQGKLSGDVDSHRQSSFGEKPTCPFNICHTMQNLTLTLKSFRKMNLLYKIMMLLYFHSLHV